MSGSVRAIVVTGSLVFGAGALLSAEAWIAVLDPVAEGARKAALLEGIRLFRIGLAAHAGLALGVGVLGGAVRPAPPLWAPSAPLEARRPLELSLLCGLLVAALAVRLIALGSDLWFDEILTLVEFVRRPIGTILTSYPHDNQHLLYSVLARASVLALGESPQALRLPAVLLGIASLWAVWRLGRLVIGPTEGLLAAALLAFSYHHVWFSQNARGYTGLLLGTTLATELWIRGLWKQRWGYGIGYGAVMALTLWVHLTAIFVVAAHAVVLLVWSASKPASWRGAVRPAAALALCGSFTFQLYALVLPQVVGYFTRPRTAAVAAAVTWKDPRWLIAETIRGLSGAVPFGGIALALGALVIATGFAALARRDRLAAAVFVLPALLGGLTLFALGRNLWPRFFFNEAGFAALFVVLGATRLGAAMGRRLGFAPRAFELGPALALIAGCLVVLPRAWALPKQNFSGARDYVLAQSRPGDRVIGLGLAGQAYRSYYAPQWSAAETLEELQALPRGPGRTWVLYTLPGYLAETQPRLMDALDRDFEILRTFPGSVGDGEVVVARSREPAP